MLQSLYSSERTDYVDPSTGATVVQWTKGPHKNQHLYFTSPSVTTDDRWLICISDRSGSPNLYAIDRVSGAIHLLSRNENGLLRSYVYPQGGLRGLSKSSSVLDADRNRLYYIRDDTVYVVAIDEMGSVERKICQMPPHWYTAYTHISPDGNTLCVPCADPRAFSGEAQSQWDQLRDVPTRMNAESLLSLIYLIDVNTGTVRLTAEMPFWVTHVQFDPAGTGRIIFNQEGFLPGTGTQIPNRIWCLDTDNSFRPLSPEPSNEWRSHENWSPDGKTIVYHGARDGRPFVATRTWEGQLVAEASMEGIACYHAIGAVDGLRLFVDKHDGLIAVLNPNASGSKILDICRHDSSCADQDAHVHPTPTTMDRSVIFTSDRTGNCNVYEVHLPKH